MLSLRDPQRDEVTPYSLYVSRRSFLRRAVSLGFLASALPLSGRAATDDGKAELTRFEDATSYNNYYEFSTNKKVIKHLARDFVSAPWQITVAGEVENAMTFDIAAIERLGLEERIYRFRCVEGWSMVVPWRGVPLTRLLAQVRPTAKARFVRFEALHDPQRFYGQRTSGALAWPYTEGLTLAEAMHPLTLIATGMYERALPPQNGAPARLVVPWKYGYKSIKAIVRISLEEQPVVSSWMQASPEEYGFYANVNPDVPHPRWSQAREVRLGEMRKRPTLLFNGYGNEVADLYRGMDLTKHA